MKTTLLYYAVLIAALLPFRASCQYKEELKEIVYHLSSPELRGRGTCDIGQKHAAGYIANYFKNNGVQNFNRNYDSIDYMQHFSLIEFKQNTVVYTIIGEDSLKVNKAYAFKSVNQTREFYFNSATVVITESDRKLRNFADTLSPKGNPILVLLPDDLYYSYQSVLNNDNYVLKDSTLDAMFIKTIRPYLQTVNLLTERFSHADSREFLLLSYNEILERNIAVEPEIQKGKKELNFVNSLRLSVSGQLERNVKETENVISVVQGKSADSPWLIVGAHYDHLGIRGKNINHGADDNASGTAALMVLAKNIANLDEKLDYNLMFVAFSAEELGLLGSNYFADSKEMPKNVKGMINMDMIGRPNPNKFNGKYVYVQFMGSGTKFMKKPMKSQKVEGLRTVKRVPLVSRIIYFFSSDHFNFYKKDIPAVVLYTGLHDDYHTSKDTPDKIEYDNLENIVIWLTKSIEAM
ncbi:MAG: M28 family peptidase [Salinivirgaceae bacterium]|jgi:hypothetical protein|nr:M28 family peptidase [Bacteroidales bacterium]